MRDYSKNLSLNSEDNNNNFKKYSFKILFPILIFSLLGIYLTYINFPEIFKVKITKTLQQVKSEPLNIKINTPATSQELLTQIEKIVSKNTGTYSIYVYDIKNNKEFGLREKTIFTAASVNKIPILAALYNLAGKGEIDLDKRITPQPSDIQDYGAGTIQYDPPGSTYSYKTLARLMMEKSDNTAAYLLANLVIGSDKIQNLVNDWGLTQTDIINNKTSNYDIAKVLIKMYKGQTTSRALTAEMLGFMTKSDYDDRLPVGLPEGTKIYHKTGDDIGNIHDVGIVDPPSGGPYFIGVLTTDINNEPEAKTAIAKISKIVYEFMISR